MEFGIVAKVIFFALWPLIFVFLYYLIDKKKFKLKWDKLKQSGWFK